MEPRNVKTIDDAKNIVLERDLKHIKVGVFDIDGVMRGKYMSRQKFFSSLDKGFGFCDVVLGWDVKDQLYDNVKFTGWHTGYPDASVRIVPSSCRALPHENNGLFFLAEFTGEAETICPRALLRRVLDQAKGLGYDVFAGFEYEFFVFNETPHSIREKGFKDLEPVDPGDFGYSVVRNSVNAEIYQSILDLGEVMDFPIEGLHEETGPGVLEAAIAVDTGMEAADKASLFKTFTKIEMQRQGKLATFMAKWSPDYPGQSGHIHLSLRDTNGCGVFFDKDHPQKCSDVMLSFLAGVQKQLPNLLALVAPTINSYRRLIPGFWAPTEASVGFDNRTCAIRVVPGEENSHRMEFRIGAADANPYLVLSAVIASGLWGIENKAVLGAMVEGNAYEQEFPESMQLPATLWDAAQKLKASGMAREHFGDAFVEHFAASREWEEREYRKHISQWELERYFEII
ncbi:glutamine synthetase [Gammaproteobacteria bacterium 45_16_T64]|nr:glutamine synthetase [Gammaproteobacteria bacterium 45_16_T64]